MEIHEEGQILELDPNKEYWMFVRAGSFLAKVIKAYGIKKKDGQVIFVGGLNEFRFIENSDRIKGIVLERSLTDGK